MTGAITGAYINGIGTAVPEHDIHAPAVAFMRTLLPEQRTRRIFDRMIDRSGISHRYSFMKADTGPDADSVDADGFYRRNDFPGTGARMALYGPEALRLAKMAVENLQASGQLDDVDSITHLVVASCTGFTAPALDLQLTEALGLQPVVQRILIGFMGCSAAIPALRTADQIVRSNPLARVLVVNLELCSLHLQETQDLERLLTLMLFADGASAALVTANPTGLGLLDFLAMIVADSQDLITWHIGDQGFDMHLSGKVPQCISQTLREDQAMGNANQLLRGYSTADFDLWAIHAGGRTILDAVAAGLELDAEDLQISRNILNDYGNMSSATVMFVLKAMLQQKPPGEVGMAMAFGPGLVVETLRFQMAA